MAARNGHWAKRRDCPKCPHDNGDHDDCGCWCGCTFNPNDWAEDDE